MTRAGSGRSAAIVSGCLALAVGSFWGASVPELPSPGLRPVTCEGGAIVARWTRTGGYIEHTLHDGGRVSTSRLGMDPGERSQRSIDCVDDPDAVLDGLRAALALVPDGPPPYYASGVIQIMSEPERRFGCAVGDEPACVSLMALESRIPAIGRGDLWQHHVDSMRGDGTRNGIRYIRGVVGPYMRGPSLRLTFAASVTDTGARCVVEDGGEDVVTRMTPGPTTTAWIEGVSRRAESYATPERATERGAAAFELMVLRDWEIVYYAPIGRTLAAEIEASLAASGCSKTALER